MFSDFVKQLQVSPNGWESSKRYIWYYFKLWIYIQEFNGLYKKCQILHLVYEKSMNLSLKVPYYVKFTLPIFNNILRVSSLSAITSFACSTFYKLCPKTHTSGN